MTAVPRPACLLLALAALALPAMAAEPFTRMTVQTAPPLVPGRQIAIDVDVFAPNYFTSPPQFPLLDLPDAVIRLPDQRSLNLTETVQGVEYTGIRKRYLMVPQRSGAYALPPAAIDLSYAGDDRKPVHATAKLPPTRFTVSDAPGAAGLAVPFAPSAVEIGQALDGDPARLSVGDALVRTITIFAADTQAMLIPQLDLAEPDFARAYRQDPDLSDDVSDASQKEGARRSERIVYTMQKAGTFALPAGSLSWYDVASGTLKTGTAPAVPVTVSPAAAVTEGIAPAVAEPQPRSPLWKRALLPGLLLLAAAGLIYLVWRWWPHLRARLEIAVERRRKSEPVRFGLVQRQLQAGAALPAYDAIQAWLRSAGFGSLGACAAKAGDSDLARRVADYDRLLFGRPAAGASFDCRQFARALAKARRRLKTQARLAAARGTALPPLNP